MRVRTIRDHDNSHGDKYHKLAKDKTEYEVRDEREARRLIKRGYVEAVKDGTASAPAKAKAPRKRKAKPAAKAPTPPAE